MVVDCCGNRESTRLASGMSIDMVSATLCQDFCPTNRILHVYLDVLTRLMAIIFVLFIVLMQSPEIHAKCKLNAPRLASSDYPLLIDFSYLHIV